MNISTFGIPKAGLPDGFVYIDELIEDCIIDAKYAGTDNFMGRPAAGYEQPLVVMSRQLADCCVKAAGILREQGYLVKFYDAYRPQSAVDDFCRWGEALDDIRRKPVHYPNEEKADVFKKGYIARRSGHTRGKAVDLTIVDMKTHQEADMGSIFDFMDERSHHGAAGLTREQEHNRRLLCDAMLSSGLTLLDSEWWHYSLDPEPYPDTYFNFPIK
jgi:D-alanyl-D-alanine dipeptidase